MATDQDGGVDGPKVVDEQHASLKPIWTAAVAAAARAQLGESPLWDKEIGLRWLDVDGHRLFTLGVNGREQSVRISSRVSAVELGPGHELLAVTSRGFGWLDPDSGRVNEVVTVVDDGTISMNDGAIDHRGRCWAGSAVRDGSWRGMLYRFEKGEATPQLHGLGMSNGIDWSPEGDVLYHADSSAGAIMAWRYDVTTGEIGDSRLVRSVPADVGLPDGLTVDADGNLWLAIWGRGEVWRLDPGTGRSTGVVEVPTPNTTSCAFGGRSLDTLFITTADQEGDTGSGLLYAADVPALGRHPHRFAAEL